MTITRRKKNSDYVHFLITEMDFLSFSANTSTHRMQISLSSIHRSFNLDKSTTPDIAAFSKNITFIDYSVPLMKRKLSKSCML